MISTSSIVSKVMAGVILAACALPALVACSSSSSPAAACALGQEWDETEANGVCTSTWVRQGDGSTFTDNQPSCDVTATLDITISGSNVTVDRTNSSDGNDCTYTGTIDSSCTSVSGTYSCSNGKTESWSATIQGGGPNSGGGSGGSVSSSGGSGPGVTSSSGGGGSGGAISCVATGSTIQCNNAGDVACDSTHCCPSNLPYGCVSDLTCYATQDEATAACGASCLACGQ